MAILLTSCVTPAVRVAINNPDQRRAELEAALSRWKMAGERIVVSDGSGYKGDDRGVEWLPCDARDIAARWGKGRAEAAIIEQAVNRSDAIANNGYFWKITGRLFVMNFAQLYQGGEIAGTFGMIGMDTRCFRVTIPAWEKYLRPVAEEIDDRQPSTFIEAVYRRASVEVMKPFVMRPRYMGRGGTRGEALDSYYPELERQRRLAARIDANLIWRKA